MKQAWAWSAILLACLGGCATMNGGPAPRGLVSVDEPEAWRSQASDEDAAALDALPALWADALGDARRGGFARRIAADGPLLDPDAGLARAAPPPGAWQCRMVRLGARTPAARPWRATGSGFCFVGVVDGQLSLTIDAGPQRIGGYLWEERDNHRLIFLGALTARGAPVGGYGTDPQRDAIGLFERIGDFRYRLAMPWHGEGKVALFELAPVPAQ